MKSLDRWLRLHHPLLWNMRLHWMLPLLLLIHGLFYLGGRVQQFSLQDLSYRYSDFEGLVASFSVLLSVLIVLGWLIFYLRNNALKSRYPVSSSRLALEFLLTLVLLLGSITPYLSYSRGRHDALRAVWQNTKLEEEYLVVAHGLHLLPFFIQDFAPGADCDSTPSQNSTIQSPAAEAADTFVHAVEGFDAALQSGTPFSYLHYCRPMPWLKGYDRLRYGADADVKRWLRGGRRDSVELALRQYLALCDKYGARYRLDPAAQTGEVFATPGFLVRTSVEGSSYYSIRSGEGQLPVQFVENDVLTESLQTVQSLGERSQDWPEEVIPWLYAAAIMALALFSFRCTSLRTWLTALIGLGLWGILFFLLGISGAYRGSGDGMQAIWLIWTIVMTVIAVNRIFAGRNKTLAGLAHLWWFWMTPAFLPLLLEYIATTNYDAPYYQDDSQNALSGQTFRTWVSGHFDVIIAINLIFVPLLAAFVWIPLARRWQAIPEE